MWENRDQHCWCCCCLNPRAVCIFPDTAELQVSAGMSMPWERSAIDKNNIVPSWIYTAPETVKGKKTSLTPRISEMFISLMRVMWIHASHRCGFPADYFGNGASWNKAVAIILSVSVVHKLVTEADFCCITEHGLLEFPTGIYCSELTAWKKKKTNQKAAAASNTGVLSGITMWLWSVSGHSKLLGVKMLFPGSSYKCLGDLQMEPSGLTNCTSKIHPLEQASCKPPVLKQRDLEIFFSSFSEFFFLRKELPKSWSC